jgi:hypothetical protein
VSRRPDPVRIQSAREAAERNRLVSAGELPNRVDAWPEAFGEVAQAERLQPTSAPYWHRAAEWIDAQRSGR